MRITYDPEADAAYVYLVSEITEGSVAQQVHSIRLPHNNGEVTLDLDNTGHILGIEILGATASLPAELLDTASSPEPPL